MVKVTLPTDCGNAPRIDIVAEFVTNWAERDANAVSAWLADDVDWKVFGSGVDARADVPLLSDTPKRLEVTSTITHGRLASCDGFLEFESGKVHFSHVFRFVNTAKNSRIREVRTYLAKGEVE